MADLSQFLNGGLAGKKVVFIGEPVKSSGSTITPNADQYVALYAQKESGSPSGALTITIGGVNVVDNIPDTFLNEINSTARGVNPAVFVGGKGESITYTYSASSLNITFMYVLLEDL